jgi:hypothetical protein
MPYYVHNEARGKTVGLCAEKCWEVQFACAKGHRGRLGSQELVPRFPAETTLDAIAERLVCSTCGSRDGDLTIRQDLGATAARDVARFSGENKYRDR